MKAKSLSVFALSVIALSALASCGGGEKDKDIEITWWNTYLVDETPDDPSDDYKYALYHYAENVIKDFEAENPKIKVKTAFKGGRQNDYKGLADAVSAGLSTGDVPHIATTYGTYAQAWTKSLVDVSDHAATLAADSDFSASYLESEKQQYGGKYYSLPYSKSTDVIMYNAEMYHAVGQVSAGTDAGDYVAPISDEDKYDYGPIDTFDRLMAVARQVKADYPDIYDHQKNADGYFEAVPVIYEDAANLFITLLESKGIPFVTADSDPVAATKFVDSPEAKEVAVNLTKWNHEGLLATKSQLPVGSSGYHDYPSTIFGKGNCFAIIASSTGAPWMAGDGYSVKWAKMVKYDEESELKAISQGPSLCFFQKKDKAEEEAALKFYDFLVKTENTAALAAQTNYFPLRASAYNNEALKAVYDAGKTTVTAASTTAQKKANYGGRVLAINEECTEGENYFMSPVYSLSDRARTAVDNLIVALFDDTAAQTNEAIRALVDEKFAEAKTYIFNA